MREIKLRVWDEGLKEMIYFTLKDANDTVDCSIYEEVMLYTGLKDRHGGEIYEGDVIEIDDGWESGEGERGEVRWDEKNAMFRLFCYTKYGGEGWFMPENKTWVKLKIVGNIYENPELLDKKER